ncbi:hypothetical protein QR680_003812 [Steinernema hermaphroditum]|uniref:Uncharacterized protein n=1 Tax=Steinernema hermaphroditum TaxID=289476 RepID=A0AA39LSX0_9BILA|nr:hypothetical protein QR680_003812 [Steinernema hermaphroditum]
MTSDKDEKALVECLRLLMDANFKYITFWGGGDQQQYEEFVRKQMRFERLKDIYMLGCPEYCAEELQGVMTKATLPNGIIKYNFELIAILLTFHLFFVPLILCLFSPNTPRRDSLETPLELVIPQSRDYFSQISPLRSPSPRLDMEYLSLLALIFLCFTSALILWYLLVTWALLGCTRKSSTFVLLTSQAINDIYALSQSAWHFAYLVAGVYKETFLPDRWLSVIHGTFELISLPHYLVIALNRAIFLIDYTELNHCFQRQTTIWICVCSWVAPFFANLILHGFERPENGGFYLFEPQGLFMGTQSSGFELKSTLSIIFEFGFCTTAICVIVIYVIAIIIHGWKRRQISIPETSFQNRSVVLSRNWKTEMRLTFVCLINLLPAIITSIMNFACPHLGPTATVFYALMTILDNSINSLVLPMFSKIVRDTLIMKIQFWDNQLRRKMTPSIVIQFASGASETHK